MPCLFRFDLAAPQLFILGLEFDLVSLQILDQHFQRFCVPCPLCHGVERKRCSRAVPRWRCNSFLLDGSHGSWCLAQIELHFRSTTRLDFGPPLPGAGEGEPTFAALAVSTLSDCGSSFRLNVAGVPEQRRGGRHTWNSRSKFEISPSLLVTARQRPSLRNIINRQ